MSANIKEVASQIEALSPADKLRFCAEVLEARTASGPEIAHAILQRVTTELGATIALQAMRKKR